MNLRLLIGGSPSKLFHLNEFSEELVKLGIETKLVLDTDYCNGFPSRKIFNWFLGNAKFEDLVKSFKPDAILVDRQRHFGLAASKTKIPLLVHLRGDYWKEIKMAKETLYKLPPKRLALWGWERIADKCFEHADLILPICKHLENRAKKYYPKADMDTMYQGINPNNWYPAKGMELNHPCVGLLQSAVIWEKAREMLTLEPVLKKMPHVTFYWVGDGPYRQYITSKLSKYENFKWLGHMQYPDKVREYLNEIDIYLLLSGIDMSPLTLLEAQLMEKPVIATNVGGIPELMINGKTGFLMERGDDQNLIEKIELLLQDENKCKAIGKTGRQFVIENFNWQKIASNFVASLKKYSLI